MQRDEPLTDEDRRPWLERIRDLAAREASEDRNAVVTCSCLKKAYRDLVRGAKAAAPSGDVPTGKLRPGAVEGLRFVHLAIDPETAQDRVGDRRGHYFDEALVASQFEALEPPRRALTLDATRPVEELVDAAVAGLGLAEPRN
jgi:gluconokinase